MNYSIFATLALCAVTVSCYPSGPPVKACNDMTPQHGVPPQPADDAPYTVTANSNTYGAGQVISVTVDSTTTNATKFRGTFLQARSGDDDAALGSWAPPDNNYKNIACSSPKGAVSHANGDDKTLPMTFQWTAPMANMEDVKFL